MDPHHPEWWLGDEPVPPVIANDRRRNAMVRILTYLFVILALLLGITSCGAILYYRWEVFQ